MWRVFVAGFFSLPSRIVYNIQISIVNWFPRQRAQQLQIIYIFFPYILSNLFPNEAGWKTEVKERHDNAWECATVPRSAAKQ